MREKDSLDRCCADLVSLVNEHLPQAWSADHQAENWTVAGPALIVRATGTLAAIFQLRECGFATDAGVLLRTMFEHLTVFAWLAAEPSTERMALWVKYDFDHQLKAHNALRELGESGWLDDVAAKRMKDYVDKVPGKLPDMCALAHAVDRHWESVIDDHPGPRSRYGFSGAYRAIWRLASPLAHPTPLGVQACLRRSRPDIVTVEGERFEPNARVFGLAATTMASGLIVSSRALGWPEVAAIDDIFAKLRGGTGDTTRR